MRLINRGVVIIKPKQPFADWVNNTPELDMDPPIDLAELREDCDSLLLPDLDSLDEAHYYLEPLKISLFEMQLADWYRDPSVWPGKLRGDLWRSKR